MKSGWYENSFEKFFNAPSYQKASCDLNEPALTVLEMKTILESSPAGIGILKNRVLGWANDIFYSMLGYDPNSLKGKNTRLLYADQEEYDRVGSGLYSNLDKYGNSLVETMLVRKDGTLFDCRIRASKLNREDPSTGIIVVITDISELKQLQLQLQQTHKMEAIGLLAGGISHDFNNILMGIQGHLSLMQIDVSATEKVRTHTKHIGRLVKTAAELTTLLLGFARGGKYQISALNANDLIVMALDIFRPTRKDIIVHETYEERLHLVDADRFQLKQVFLNLLINASQAMSEQGDIFVTTQNIFIKEDHEYPFEIQPGRYIQVTIQDTGIGMDMETRKKIFDPFFSTKEVGNKKGRGLGLSNAFGVIKNHGGFIIVDSDKGKGASFHVCLPASHTIRRKEKEKEPQLFEHMQKGSETILLVDDEDEVVNAGKKFLEKLGYKTIVARNGVEAVEIFKLYKDEISLVVLDLIMPKMNGKQAFSEIKNIREDAKILISTGYAIDDKIKGFLNQGCHGFIQKPFSLNEFSSILRKILDKTV